MGRRFRNRLALGFALAALTPAGGASPALADVTIGSPNVSDPGTASTACGTYPCGFSQTALVGQLLTSPVNGQLSGWSMNASVGGTTARLRLLHPLGGSMFELRYVTDTASGLTAGPHSFGGSGVPLIDKGDVFALELISGGLASRSTPGASANLFEPMPQKPDVNQPVRATPTGTTTGTEYLFSLTIEPESFPDADLVGRTKRGDAIFKVRVENPGLLRVTNFRTRPRPGGHPVSNRLIKPVSVSLEEGKSKVVVRPSKLTRRQVASRGRTHGKIEFSFVPIFGDPSKPGRWKTKLAFRRD